MKGAGARYGRRKVVAALATFGLLWVWLTWFAPGVRDAIEELGFRPPHLAFEERTSGETVRGRGVVTAALPDSADALGAIARWRVQERAGHAFTVLARPECVAGAPAPGDTVEVLGTYRWDLRGGTVLVDAGPKGGRPGRFGPDR